MTRRCSLVLAALALLGAPGTGLVQETKFSREPAASASFFVSPHGNDRWSGKLAAPNAAKSDGPFATLGRAQEAVRESKARTKPGQPLVVLVRGGRYELQKPIRFGPGDSGTKESPVIYAAYPGETPIFSGGFILGGWQQADGGLWKAKLPPGSEASWTCRRIVVNGKACARPRLPKEGFYRVAGYAGIDQKKYNTPSDRFEFRPGDVNPRWKNLQDVECVVLHFWVDTHLKIATVDESAQVVKFDRFSRRRFSDDYRGQGARYYIENVFEALDTPGHFYIERSAATIYYLPRPGEQIGAAEVIVPRLDQLVLFEGEPAKKRFVEHVHLRGLTFTDSTWEPPAKEAADAQAASVVPGAVVLTGARHCHIEKGTLRHLGSYAIELRDGCQDNRLVGNEISHCAAGGIRLSGGAAGAPEFLRTANNVITDNHIHHCGEVFHSGVGILSQHSAGNLLAHNHIHHLYYTGISVGWVWGYGPSVSRGNRVEFNHIHDIGQGLLSDMGGVYLLGVSPGTVVRNNLIHDVDSWSYGGWGIYTDEGSTGIVIENNVVYRTKSGGFHQHYGKDNMVRNNVFALARTEQIARSRKEAHRSFTFERNIVYYREGALLGKNWDGDGFIIDHNLYFNAAGKPITFPGGDLASWQKRGHDVHSLVVDPKFRAPDKGDFTLLPDSPAFKLGFKPIDVSTVGPRTQATAQQATASPAGPLAESWDYAPAMRKVAARFAGVEGVVLHVGGSMTIANPYGTWARSGKGQTVADRAILKWMHTDAKDKTDGWWLCRMEVVPYRAYTAESGLKSGMLLNGGKRGLPPLAKLLATYRLRMVTLEVGIYDVEDNVPLEEYAANMGKSLDLILEHGAIPILNTIPPFKAQLERTRAFNEALRRLARERGIPVLDLEREILSRRPDDWFGNLMKRIHLTASEAGVSPGAEPTAENLARSGYLLRGWLTVRKIAEVKARVLD